MGDNRQPKAESHASLDTAEYLYWAEKTRDGLIADRAALLSYISDQSRWMIASLLFLNAGALVAMHQNLMAGEQVAPLAGRLFVAGAVAAIMCGLATWAHAQWAVFTVSNPLSDPIWLLRPEAFPEIPKRTKQLNTVGVFSSLFIGLVSLGLFIAGVLAFEAAANRFDTNSRRCQTIQNDMLSSSPRRSDGPALFQALRCKPFGEGKVYLPPKRGPQAAQPRQ